MTSHIKEKEDHQDYQWVGEVEHIFFRKWYRRLI
jgi:hypothetical protein